MLKKLRDQAAFFRQFRQQFETTGAVAPSSRFLAKSMTRYLRQRGTDPVRVLEIGPGTGAVTSEIVKHLRHGDVFDLVELNDAFVDILEQRFLDDPVWNSVSKLAKVHTLPLQDFAAEHPYDFVISGLPLNNFPVSLVQTLTESYFRLLKPGGVLSYFEYMFVRPVRKVVSRGNERTRISGIDEIMQRHCDRCRIRRDSIWINVPPAWVQHLRLEETRGTRL
ncbi:MAG: methyltransferase domain-containing protein [Planctomycetaceae bacterium]